MLAFTDYTCYADLIVKGLARLILVCTLSFIGILALLSVLIYMYSWIAASDSLFMHTYSPASLLFQSMRRALPPLLYICMLVSISYSARRGVPALPSLLVLIVLLPGLCIGSYELIEALDTNNTNSDVKETVNLNTNGLMLVYPEYTLLMTGPESDPLNRGIRVYPYQDAEIFENITVFKEAERPDLFRQERPRLVFSAAEDFTRISEHWAAMRTEGLPVFAAVLAVLVFLLMSLRCVMELSAWPLANLVLTLILFRAVLYMDVLFATQEAKNFLRQLSGFQQPEFLLYLLPLLLVGVVVHLYSLLNYAASYKGKSHEES